MVGILLGTSLLTSCSRSESVSSVVDNYVYRLSNVFSLDVDIDDSVLTLQRYPAQRELRFALSPTSINLLDFLRLSQCDVQRHIGGNNSSLGKLAPASQSLLYEIEFVRLASLCLAQRRERGEQSRLDQALADAINIKQAEWPKLQWNVSFASDEFRHLFSFDTTLSAMQLAMPPSELIAALVRLTQYFETINIHAIGDSTAFPISNSKFEHGLAVIGSEKYMGKLHGAVLMFNRTLPVLTQHIDQQQAARPLCVGGRLTAKGKIMHTVFLRFYIGEVQPLLSQLVQRITRLKSEIAALRSSMNQVEHDEFDAYWQAVWSGSGQSVYGDFLYNVAEHTRMWQDNLLQCGLMPGVEANH